MVFSFFQNLKKTNKVIQPGQSADGIDKYLDLAEQIEGWVDRDELTYKANIVSKLPENAQIVEIGSFLGKSTVLMAGARKLAGSGMVHVIDPFDASGDAFSVPFYKSITKKISKPLYDQFMDNVAKAGLQDYVKVYRGTAESVVKDWTDKIDMLILDGDQSPKGARSAYELWIPFLKPGGYLCLHNSGKRLYVPGHDGHRKVLLDFVKEPDYTEIHTERKTSFARKV